MDSSELHTSQEFSPDSIVVLDRPPPYNPTLEPAYTVLGFLDEYLGRRIVESQETVEWFYPGEVAIADRFEEHLHNLQQELGLTTNVKRIIDARGFTSFVSRELTTVINAYYTENLDIDRTSTRLNKGPFLYASNQLPHTVFKPGSGWRLKPEEYNPRFSFLVGAYQRYGKGNAYSFANSFGKAELVRTLLCDIGCEYVGLKLWMKGAPTICEVEFEPTEDLCTLFSLPDTRKTEGTAL